VAHAQNLLQSLTVLTKILSVCWYDNRQVNQLSTFAGTNPVGKARQWFKSEKIFKDNDCPHVVTIYNKYMGGVDLMDSIMGLYIIRKKSRKWYHRIFYHLLDMSVANAWLLYRRARVQDGTTSTS